MQTVGPPETHRRRGSWSVPLSATSGFADLRSVTAYEVKIGDTSREARRAQDHAMPSPGASSSDPARLGRKKGARLNEVGSRTRTFAPFEPSASICSAQSTATIASTIIGTLRGDGP
jgi:hypothetical protein